MVQFDCPMHLKSSVSSTFKVGWIPFPHYWPSGVIRIGLPVWRWKNWYNFKMWEVQRAANGPVWMSQAPKPLCLIQFWSWENSFFWLLALLGNKNWPPSMKVKKIENFQKVRGAKGCKWSSLNAPCTQSPMSHLILKLGEFIFPIVGPLGK